MKKIILGIIVGLLSGGVGVWLYLHHKGGEPEAKKEEEKKEESLVQHGTNGETFLKLGEETQNRAGLKIAVLEAAQLKPEAKGFGRVIDPSPLAASLTEIAAAQSQVEASGKEAARLKILFAQNQNASARSVETAEAAVRRDRIAAEAAQLRLLSSWGKALVDRPDLDAFIRALVARENALVRVEIPPADKPEVAPTSARLALLSAPETPIEAEFLGADVSADPQTQGRGFFVLVKGRALPANAAVTAWLSFPGEPEKGVIIPREAIVRHAGEAFIYVKTGDETFVRKEIALHHPLGAGWFTDEIDAGVNVVISGAQQLLSEELKGQGGEE